MHARRIAWVILVVALVAALIMGIRDYVQYRTDVREEAQMASFRSDWLFNPDDPELLEARFLATDGIYAVSLGFPTIVERNGEQFVDFVSASATFLDFGATQIHMASNPNATLADIPLGSTVKIRAGADGSSPGNYVLYDILVLE